MYQKRIFEAKHMQGFMTGLESENDKVILSVKSFLSHIYDYYTEHLIRMEIFMYQA